MGPSLAQSLRYFDVLAADHEAILRADVDARTDAALSGWVTATAHALEAAIGRPSPPPALPSRPTGPPDTVAYLPVLAYADVLPATLSWARSRGIPDTVMAATMRDVGRMLVRNRLWFGRVGLDDELAGWLTRHLMGSILEVGRLQYERSPLGTLTTAWLQDQGAPIAPGELGVKLHVPEPGPFTAERLLDSLRAGRSLVRRRFPEERATVRVCISWLLDPQLAEYLLPTSNILAFQRLFRPGPVKGDEGDLAVRKFVFGTASTADGLDALPQTSTLQRAVVQHWRAGRRWWEHLGWLDESRI